MLIGIALTTFILLQQKKKLNFIKKYVKIKIAVMYLFLLKTLKRKNLIKIKTSLLIIHPDLDCIIEKIKESKNNRENLSTIKLSQHIPSGFSLFKISPFRSKYRGKYCLKKFCEYLGEHAIKIIRFKKKKNEITNKIATRIIRKCTIYYICQEKFEINYLKDRKCCDLEIIVIIQLNIEVLLVAYLI